MIFRFGKPEQRAPVRKKQEIRAYAGPASPVEFVKGPVPVPLLESVT